MHSLLNRHQTSQALEAFTVQCPRGTICKNTLQLRSVQQNLRYDHLPFWFTEKVYETVTETATWIYGWHRPHAHQASSSSGLKHNSVLLWKTRRISALKGIAGVLKHSVPKYRHSGLLCPYVAEENTDSITRCTHHLNSMWLAMHVYKPQC